MTGATRRDGATITKHCSLCSDIHTLVIIAHVLQNFGKMPVGKIHKKKKFRGCATSGVCGKGRKTEVHYCYARSLFNCTIVRHILPTGPIVNAVCMCVSMYVRMYVWYVFVWTLISQTKKTASAINLCSQCWSSK